MKKSDQLKIARKWVKDELEKRDKLTFGEYLYKYHFGTPNIAWEECCEDYRKQMEKTGQEIIKEVLRRSE